MRTRRFSHRRCGFTLIEAMISMTIVAVVLLAAIRAAGASARAHYQAAQRFKAQFLATGLIAEVLQTSYEEPRGGTIFGRDADELAGSKTNYNDVDDFHGWTESPPQERGGSPIPNLAGWQRSVTVEWVNPDDLSKTSAFDTGAKRVTITVRYNNSPVASHIAVRTRAP